jgi:hypothetical protein
MAFLLIVLDLPSSRSFSLQHRPGSGIRRMHALLTSLYYGDFFPLFLLSFTLYKLGGFFASTQPVCIRYFWRAGYFAFVGFGIFAFLEFPPSDHFKMFAILVRSVLVGGMAAGAIGIFLPALLWLNRTFIEGPRAWLRSCVGEWNRKREKRRLKREQLRLRKESDAEWERKRPQREREALEMKRQMEDETKRRGQQDIVNAVKDLEVRRRGLLAAFVQNKPYLDEAEWDEKTFLSFEWYAERIRDGRKTEVFAELQRLDDSMQCDAAIGEVKHLYDDLRPIIEADISARMLSSLIGGIPKESPSSTIAACDEIRKLLAASHHRRAPSYQALQEGVHLDSLEAALDGRQIDPEEQPLLGTEIKIHRAVGE